MNYNIPLTTKSISYHHITIQNSIYLAEVRLSNFLHLDQNHWRDFLREERLCFTLVLDTNLWFAAVADHIKRPHLHVWLDRRVVKTSSNQSLRIKHRVIWIHRHLQTATFFILLTTPIKCALHYRWQKDTEFVMFRNVQRNICKALRITVLSANCATATVQNKMVILLDQRNNSGRCPSEIKPRSTK